MPDVLSPDARRARLFAEASSLGFNLCGIAPADRPLPREALLDWLGHGYHAEMAWMERTAQRRLDPHRVWPGVRSVIVLALDYNQEPPPDRARLARYALGGDYHSLILKRLKQLCTLLRSWGGDNKPYVDTGPVMERAWAVEAGLGWIGRHTNLIHPRLGNWLFLATIFTTLELPADSVMPNRCGSCVRCLEACPTQAFPAPGRLDARRCLAYLTIENPGPIPHEFRRALGSRLFGCDDCLAVCPWNRWASQTREARLLRRPLPDVRDTLAWGAEQFREAFAGTPVNRLGVERWRRNASVVLGNIGTPADLPALYSVASQTPSLAAAHAVWAIQEITGRAAPAASG